MKITKVFHYTSISALISIITNKSLRFSDYRFLNDPEEVNYGIDLLKQILSKEDEKVKEFLRPYITMAEYKIMPYREKNVTIEIPYSIYSFSCSLIPDSISMWNIYTKEKNKGICIEINIEELKKELALRYKPKFNNASFNKAYKIIYKKNDQIKSIENLINSAKQIIIAKEEGKLNLNDEKELNIFVSGWADKIINGCTCLKKDSFSYEEEFRFYEFFPLPYFDTHPESFASVFYENKGVIIPQIEFKNIAIEKIFNRIIISPYNTQSNSIIGLEHFLVYNKVNIPIEVSKQKIR